MVNKLNKGCFKKGNKPWNLGRKINLDLERIEAEHIDGKSIMDISKELGVSDRLIRIRLKEYGLFIRKKSDVTKITRQKISKTNKLKGIQPKERYSGVPWNKGKKGVQVPWNKGKKTGQKNWKNRTFTEETIKKIKEARAKQIFPLKDTTIELKIQELLRQLKVDFYTHHYIREIDHAYQCDIMIPVQERVDKKTIIECFGTYWHDYPLARNIDVKRCRELRKKGWRVLVFWENEIRVMESKDLKLKII